MGGVRHSITTASQVQFTALQYVAKKLYIIPFTHLNVRKKAINMQIMGIQPLSHLLCDVQWQLPFRLQEH